MRRTPPRTHANPYASAAAKPARGAWWWEVAALAGVVVLAAGLRVYDLGGQPLWLDEGATIRMAERPLALLWGPEGLAEPTPPLYTTLVALTAPDPGEPAQARLPAAVLGTLATLFVFGVGRVAFGREAGLLAALLFGTATPQLAQARDAQPYAMLTCAAMAAAWSFVVLVKHRDRVTWRLGKSRSDERDAGREAAGFRREQLAWAGWFAGALWAMSSHPSGVLLPLVATLIVAVIVLRDPRRGRRFGVNWVIVNALVLLGWSWWLPTLLYQVAAGIGDGWATTTRGAAELVRAAFGQPDLANPVARLAAEALAVGLAGFAVWRARRSGVAWAIVALVAVVPVVLVVIGAWRPVLTPPGTLVWPAALLPVLAAAGALALPRRWLRVGAAVLLLGANAAAMAWFFPTPREERWDLAAKAVSARAGDGVLILPAWAEFVYQAYARRAPAGVRVYGLDDPPSSGRLQPWAGVPRITSEQLAIVGDRQERWWVVAWSEDGVAPRIREALGPQWTFRERYRRGPVRVLLATPPGVIPAGAETGEAEKAAGSPRQADK